MSPYFFVLYAFLFTIQMQWKFDELSKLLGRFLVGTLLRRDLPSQVGDGLWVRVSAQGFPHFRIVYCLLLIEIKGKQMVRSPDQNKTSLLESWSGKNMVLKGHFHRIEHKASMELRWHSTMSVSNIKWYTDGSKTWEGSGTGVFGIKTRNQILRGDGEVPQHI